MRVTSFIRAADHLDTSTTRKISLTSSGEAFIEKARQILDGVAEAEGIGGEHGGAGRRTNAKKT
jgi:DNA-binding transcriptional LysR family regulator